MVLYCKFDDKFNQWGLKVPGKQLAENLSRVLSPEGNGTEDVALCYTDQNDSVNWQGLEKFETLFIVDSKYYNPYLKLVLDKDSYYSKNLKGQVDFEKYTDPETTDEKGKEVLLQKIVTKDKKLSFQSTKYDDPSTRMDVIDEFEDYLLIMRLPREIAPRAKALQGKGAIWVIAGIHGKATQAGVSFLSTHFSMLHYYLSNRNTHSPPEFFEAVLRIPKKSRYRNDGLVLHFNELELDTLDNDRTAPESDLVYFQELHTSTEPGLRDSRPFGLAKHFCPEKPTPAEIPIHSAHLDVVAGCNFDCQDCIVKSELRKVGAMLSFTSICKMLIELREAGCVRVRFDGGEPTLHPDFPWIVRLAAALGFEMDLVTNGSLLSDQKIQQAIVSAKKLLRLRVSLSDYSPGISQKPLDPDLKNTPEEVKKTTEEAVLHLIGEGVAVGVSMLLYNDCIEKIEKVEKANEFWRSKGAKSLCLLPVLNKGGVGQKRGHEWAENDKRKLRNIIDESKGWVIVPDWYHAQLYGDECASTTEDYDCCYSAYYRIAISPAKGTDGPKRQTNWPELELPETDRAWISLCPYHRYDEGYGCDYSPRYKGGLQKWMKGRRLEIAESIKPNKCQKTTCSSDAYNRQTYEETKGI